MGRMPSTIQQQEIHSTSQKSFIADDGTAVKPCLQAVFKRYPPWASFLGSSFMICFLEATMGNKSPSAYQRELACRNGQTRSDVGHCQFFYPHSACGMPFGRIPPFCAIFNKPDTSLNSKNLERECRKGKISIKKLTLSGKSP